MDPQVIHLILCDRVYYDPRNLLRLNVSGVQIRVRARKPPPVQHDFVALAIMVGFTGRGESWIRVIEQATDQCVSQSPRRILRFPSDPEEVFAFRILMDRCTLPRYGRYRLELCLDREVIATRPFWLLPKT